MLRALSLLALTALPAVAQSGGQPAPATTAATIFKAACIDGRATKPAYDAAGRAAGLSQSGHRWYHPSADLLIELRTGAGGTPRCIVRFLTTDRGNRLLTPFKRIPGLQRQDKEVLRVRGSDDFILIAYPDTVRGQDYASVVYVVQE